MPDLLLIPRFVVLLLAGALCSDAKLYAQDVIHGKVTTENGGPLSQANVFVNGSTLGTMSAGDGSFTLYVGKTGFVELVVSHVGYEPLVHRIEMPAIRRFVFRLQPKEQVLRNVVVLTASMRKQWLQIFKDNFLGITHAGRSAKIINEEDVQFEAGPSGSISAYSDQPLEIVNKELGYRIFFELIAFTYSSEHTSFIGLTRYQELGKNTARTKARTRRKYYEGSSTHFFRSLIAKQLDAAGFGLRLLQEVSAPADTAKHHIGARNEAPAARQTVVYSVPVQADSLINLLQQENGTLQYQLAWKGRLQVEYRHEPHTKYYLQWQVLLQGGRPKGYVAYIDIKEPPVLLDGQGALANPLSLAYGGFWVYEKLGSMLPADYQPD